MKKKIIALGICAALVMTSIFSSVIFAEDVDTAETYDTTEDASDVIEESTVEDESFDEAEPVVDDEITEATIETEVEEESEEESVEELAEEPAEEILEEPEEAVEEIIEETVEEIVDETTGETEVISETEATAGIVDETVSENVGEEIATPSEIEEIIDEIATKSEIEEVVDDVATASEISVKVFWINDMSLKDTGLGGTYNYEWDTFTVKEGENFVAPEKVTNDIKHSSCDQEYKFVGFTTEDQKEKYWLHADYAAGEKTLDGTFPVEADMTVWAVYEAKDTYVSSIKVVDGELTFTSTTIPNTAIKNIMVSDKAFEDLKAGYKVVKNDKMYIAYTKDSAEGKPMLEASVKEKVQ